MVTTGEKDVDIYFQNRIVGKTDKNGVLLVPGLLAFESNHLHINPANWPIHWVAGEVAHDVVPPRGGGVLVPFKNSTRTWPAQTLLSPLAPNGKAYPPGTVVQAVVDGEPHDTVIDRHGQLWIAELLPTTGFSITQADQRCEFALAVLDSSAESVAPAPSLRMTPGPCREAP